MKIAYLVSRFPHLPESFVLRELDALEQEGFEVVLCPLLRNDEPVSHPEAARWIERAWYTPFLSREIAGDAAVIAGRRPLRVGATAAVAAGGLWRSPNLAGGAAALAAKTLHLGRRLEREGVTHVHAHFATHPAMVAWMIARTSGLGYSFTAHAHDLYVDDAFLATKVRDARFVVTISEYNRRLLEGYGGEGKTHVIHCGVELERYRFRRRQARTPVRILSVASLQPYKGLVHLVDACAELQRRGVAVECRIAGGGELEGSLRERIAALGLESSVTLVGPQPQERVVELLDEADVFVLPSIVTPSGKMEGLPVALMEALAAGVPVVATAISGIPELIRPGETGLLVPAADPDAIASAVEQILADPDAAAARSEAGRALVEQEFDVHRNTSELAQLFLREAGR